MLTSVPQTAVPLPENTNRAFKKAVVKYALIGLLSLPLFLPSHIFSDLFQTLSHFRFEVHWFVKLYLTINVVVLTYFMLVYFNAHRRQRKMQEQSNWIEDASDIVVNEEEIAAAFERTIFPQESVVLINGQLYNLAENHTEQLVKDSYVQPMLKISNQ